MAPPNPALLIGASKQPTRASSTFTSESPYWGSDLQEAFTAGVCSDRCLGRAVSGELGYGCVDWYIYVTDPAVPIGTAHASNE
jgi:hypothetical protein